MGFTCSERISSTMPRQEPARLVRARSPVAASYPEPALNAFHHRTSQLLCKTVQLWNALSRMLRVQEGTMKRFVPPATLPALDVRLREQVDDVAHLQTVLDMQARRIAQMYDPDGATISDSTRWNLEGEETLCH